MGDLMESRIDGDFRIECETRGLNPNTATLYDLLVKVRDAAHLELKQISDTPPPAPTEYERRYQHGDEAYAKGVEDGREEARLEHEHRKLPRAPIEAPGLTVHHVGDLKLTVVLGGLSTPDKN